MLAFLQDWEETGAARLPGSSRLSQVDALALVTPRRSKMLDPG